MSLFKSRHQIIWNDVQVLHGWRRRQAFISSMTLLLTVWPRPVIVCGFEIEHSFWSTIERFNDDQWKCHPRMSQATFDYLIKVPIVPIVLWWFATPEVYRTIPCLFGAGIATVYKLV